MTAQIIPFQFKTTQVRTIEIDDLIWFVAGDVAKALDYPEAKDMTRILDDDEKGRHIVPTLGGDQELLTINESGLYHAILKSRKPEAVPFRKWVTNEVLPAIRKTGRYDREAPAPAPASMGGEIQSIRLKMDDPLVNLLRNSGSNWRWLLTVRKSWTTAPGPGIAELDAIPDEAKIVTDETLPEMIRHFSRDAQLAAIKSVLEEMQQEQARNPK